MLKDALHRAKKNKTKRTQKSKQNKQTEHFSQKKTGEAVRNESCSGGKGGKGNRGQQVKASLKRWVLRACLNDDIT